MAIEHGYLRPQVDELGAPFWEGAAAGELRIQACVSCGNVRFPPRPMCPACHSVDATWRAMSGRGTVWSFIVPHAPVLPEFADVLPFTIVVVALDDAPHIRLIGTLEGDVEAKIDLPVRAVFPEVERGVHLVRWVALP